MTVTGPDTDGVMAPDRPQRLGLRAQIVRFVVIGGLAAVVDLGVYQGLVHLHFWAPLAKGIAFILGTTTAYLLNRRYTFASSTGSRSKFAGFVLLYGSTFFVNVGVAALVLHVMGAPTIGTPAFPTFVSWFVAQACATSINFLVMRLVIFRD